MKVFGRIIYWGLSIPLCIANNRASDAPTAASPPAISSQVTELLRTAASNARNLPGYVTVSYDIINGSEAKLTKYIKNGEHRLHLSRIEVMVSPTPGKSVDLTYIINESGSWKIDGKKVTRLNGAPNLERGIPLRLSTPDLLGLKDALTYVIEDNVTFFEIPAKKITISVSTELRTRLKKEPEILIRAIQRHSPAGNAENRKGIADADWLKLADSQFPATYVYIVSANPAFILSWRSYSLSGKKLSEVNYQEFKADPALPMSLFAIPADGSAN